MLRSVAEVKDQIATGKPLFLAGSESALSQLPTGNWIGGTISYFMDDTGGTCSESQIFVTEIPDCALDVQIVEYTAETVSSICKEAPENGFSFVIMPAGSQVQKTYAHDAPQFEEMFLKPVVGWISGVLLSQIGEKQSKVFNGRTGASSAECAVVMQVALPAKKQADLEIVNIFRQGSGDALSFSSSGFSASECFVNGKPMNLAKYISGTQADTRIPLTADYNGSIVNVSIQSVDEANGTVNFYAPVFSGVEYKFAAPVADYAAAFESATNDNGTATFSCNCILNYVYGDLKGKRLGAITGPITFGEIAHQLLNQTLVRLLIRDIA